MEITTCEEYVLMELQEAQIEAANLRNENERLEAQIEILQRNAEPSRLERYVVEKGRETLFSEATGYSPQVRDDEGERIPFDVFCEEFTRDYQLPKWLSKAEFARAFEPEFRKVYENAIAEEGE